MSIEVIGAGWGRTGTLSLKVALEQLGFDKCYHMKELIERPETVTFWEKLEQGKEIDWDELFKGYKATVDHPSCNYYIQLMNHYPHAKVILTVREPEKWYESAFNTTYQISLALDQEMPAQQGVISTQWQTSRRTFQIVKLIVQRDFQGKFEDKEYMIDIFKKHIEEVKQNIPAEKLLVYQVKEGWQPLCDFLNVPVPDIEFPHLNERKEFKHNFPLPS